MGLEFYISPLFHQSASGVLSQKRKKEWGTGGGRDGTLRGKDNGGGGEGE